MSLRGKRIALLAGPDYEDLELHYPHLRLKEEGAEVDVIALTREAVRGKHGLSIAPDKTFDGAKPGDYDAVVIPGGWAPDRLRRHEKVLRFLQAFDQGGRLIAAICHGPQLLISARLVKGRRLTCFHAIKDDVINAGGKYVDEAAVQDRNLVTSRGPEDLPAFCRAIIKGIT